MQPGAAWMFCDNLIVLTGREAEVCSLRENQFCLAKSPQKIKEGGFWVRCKFCRQMFEPNKYSPHQKYCSPACRHSGRKIYKKHYDNSWRKSNPSYMKEYCQSYRELYWINLEPCAHGEWILRITRDKVSKQDSVLDTTSDGAYNRCPFSTKGLSPEYGCKKGLHPGCGCLIKQVPHPWNQDVNQISPWNRGQRFLPNSRAATTAFPGFQIALGLL